MIRLRFYNGSPTEAVMLGPAPWFRIAGNFIREGPHGAIVGSFLRHHWEVQAKHFLRYDCEGESLVHFEDHGGGASQDFGPFSCFSSADGALYGNNELFAKFVEESQLWHCYPTENYWPIIVIQAAKLVP
jgi:hypothetical protein